MSDFNMHDVDEYVKELEARVQELEVLEDKWLGDALRVKELEADLKRHRNAYTSRNIELEAEVKRLQHMLMQDTVPDEFTKTHDELRARVQELEAENKAYAWTESLLSDENERLREEATRHGVERAKADARVQALETEVKRQTSQIDRMQETYNTVYDDRERLRERNNDSNFHQREKAKEISRLKGEVTIRDGRVQELEATLHNFENWKCAQENASLKTEVERLREERDAAIDALVGQARRQYREALDALAEQEPKNE